MPALSSQRKAKKIFSSKELLCSTVNVVAKCFDEAHLGPLSQIGRASERERKETKVVALCVLEEQ